MLFICCSCSSFVLVVLLLQVLLLFLTHPDYSFVIVFISKVYLLSQLEEVPAH